MWNRSSFCLKVQKIISGGQMGVDRAGLDVALDLGLAVGGWCPKGRRAEDGQIPDRYPLVETLERNYPVRTRRNVEDSDGTLILKSRNAGRRHGAYGETGPANREALPDRGAGSRDRASDVPRLVDSGV